MSEEDYFREFRSELDEIRLLKQEKKILEIKNTILSQQLREAKLGVNDMSDRLPYLRRLEKQVERLWNENLDLLKQLNAANYQEERTALQEALNAAESKVDLLQALNDSQYNSILQYRDDIGWEKKWRKEARALAKEAYAEVDKLEVRLRNCARAAWAKAAEAMKARVLQLIHREASK